MKSPKFVLLAAFTAGLTLMAASKSKASVVVDGTATSIGNENAKPADPMSLRNVTLAREIAEPGVVEFGIVADSRVSNTRPGKDSPRGANRQYRHRTRNPSATSSKPNALAPKQQACPLDVHPDDCKPPKVLLKWGGS